MRLLASSGSVAAAQAEPATSPLRVQLLCHLPAEAAVAAAAAAAYALKLVVAVVVAAAAVVIAVVRALVVVGCARRR